MKILAIRGANLASLAGTFEIDLTDGPLGAVGLYAITGPTGAGKSTLLDALCLALFNKTPRLGNQGGVAIGAENEAGLKDSDPRSLLRRGAVSGFAEVDFRGADGKRYRARWSVRRARQKADGGVMDEDLMLSGLDDPLFLAAGKKHEVLAAIAAKLGLTFEQFKQSVLLAQGDFAAFLKAKGTERAQLLERMTGTEIYGRLSMRAALKAQEAQQAVATHQEAMAGFQPLGAEERTALESSLADLKAKAAAQEALVKELEAGQRWYADLALKLTKETDAETAASDAGATWEVAAPRQAELEAVRSAQPLRAEVEAADAGAAALKAASNAHAIHEAALLTAREDDTREADALAKATKSLSAAEEAARDAAPDIDAAKALDAQVEVADAAAKQKASNAATLAAEATEAEAQSQSLGQALAQSQGCVNDAKAWLERNTQTGPLAAEWGRWQQELTRYVAAHAECRGTGQERSGLVQAVTAAEAAHREASDFAQAMAQEACGAKEGSDQAAKAAGEFDSAALERDRSALGSRRDLLVGLEGLRVLADLASRQAGEQRQTEADRSAAGVLAQTEIAGAEAARSPLAATLEEAERAERNFTAARSLADHRATLVAGEACPLCGAIEHPWGRAAGALDDLAAQQSERVSALRASLTDLDATLKAARATLAQATTDAEAAAAKATGHEAEIAKHREAWAGQVVALDAALPQDSPSCLPQDPGDPSAAPRLAELQAQTKMTMAAVEAHRTKAQEAEKAAKKAAKAYQEALTASAGATARATEAEKKHSAAVRALKDLDQRLFEAEKKQTEAEAALAGAFGDREAWRSELQADPVAFLNQCRSLVEAWNSQSEISARAAAEVADITPKHAAALASAQARREEAAKAVADASDLARDLGDKRQARSLLLCGQPTAAFEAALRTAVAAAAKASQEAAALREEAGKKLASAEATVAQAQHVVLSATTQAGKAAEALGKALEAAGTDLPTLRARLSRDKAWIAAEESTLGGLYKRLTETAQAFVLLRTQREDHEQADRPRWEAPDVGPALESAGQEHAATQAQATTAAARLQADDSNREQGTKAMARLAELQADASLWGSLSDVIGQKDGNKFRRFAQSLTLDALLALANEHLRLLAPRYRLMRVPHASRDSQALELQVVDVDMGDEIRSTNTLSGGESFLVSLALALGLSSLAARNTKIDSLFIDEGFGTLDSATLEVALATLDALQAEGRQVGLISHVPGLGDRIGAQVRVEPRGTGRSTVRVVTELAVAAGVSRIPELA